MNMQKLTRDDLYSLEQYSSLRGEFREKVLAAYHSQCAFCRLRHRELLDAAQLAGLDACPGRGINALLEFDAEHRALPTGFADPEERQSAWNQYKAASRATGCSRAWPFAPLAPV